MVDVLVLAKNTLQMKLMKKIAVIFLDILELLSVDVDDDGADD